MKKIVFYSTFGGFGHVARDLAIAKELVGKAEVHIITGVKVPFELKGIILHQISEIPAISMLNDPITFTEFYKGSEGPLQYRKHFLEYVNLLDELKPDLVIADVTCEFAIYAKLMGFKVASVYITGKRDDLRHQLNFNSVDHIIVPYPKGFTDVDYLPKEIQPKMFFSGGFSRLDGRKILDKKLAKEKIGLDPEDYLIICSAGKGDFADKLKEVFEKSVKSLEGVKTLFLDNIPDVSGYLNATDLAVTGVGDNTVMENCYFQVPTITIPLKRPYQEQVVKADDLARAGAMIAINEADLTPAKLAQTILDIKNNPELIQKMKEAEDKIVDGQGAERLAREIIKWTES